MTFSRLWSTALFPLSQRTAKFPHNCALLYPCHLINKTIDLCHPLPHLTKEKDFVIKSHQAQSNHWPGQSSRDLSPLPSRGVIHLSRGEVFITRAPAPSDQQHLVKNSVVKKIYITPLPSDYLCSENLNTRGCVAQF